MKTKPQIVSFQCVLKNSTGQVISDTFYQDVITQLESPAPCELPALPEGLRDVKRGELRKIKVSAKDAYGLYDPGLACQISARDLKGAGQIALGDRVRWPDRSGELRLYSVTRIQGGTIDLDANHPLAGQDLEFEVRVLEARAATKEEVREAGQVEPKPYLN